MLSHDCSRERNERDMLACSFGFALPYAMVLGGEASAAGNAATGGGSDSECVASEEEAAAEASTPVGQRGSPMTVQRGTNSPAEIGGRQYGGHALDEMQSEGFTPTVVEDAIAQGQSSVGASGRIAYYSQANNITVIVEDGRVVTVTSGTVKVR
jgi:hypothetical protein